VKAKALSTLANPLKQLNGLFLQSYAARKESIKKTLGVESPVMVLKQDDLVLLYRGKKTSITYVPEVYHQIKEIAHISCLIHILHWMQEKKLKITTLAIQQKRIMGLLEKVELSLKSPEVSPVLKQHAPILKVYQQLVAAIGTEGLPPKLLGLKVALEALIQDAAKVRIDALHAEVKKLRGRMCPMQWTKLAIVVLGPHMPREGELGMQYASKMLLNAPKETPGAEQCPHLNGTMTNTAQVFQGMRLMYGENLKTVDEALSLVATHVCDEELGKDLLGDAAVMRADFLKTAVQKHLPTLKW
jgi:hypothetical protein